MSTRRGKSVFDPSASGCFLTHMETVMRVIIALLLMLSTYAHAGCGNISDSDQRAYCEAKTNGQSCGNIRDNDLRASCSAEMNGQSCGNISDNDQRAFCNATVNGQSCGNIQDSNLRNKCDAIKR